MRSRYSPIHPSRIKKLLFTFDQVPELLEDFGAKISLMKQHSAGNRQAGLKVAAAIKSLSNEFKRSQGKRVMMRKLGLMRERSAEEAALCAAAPSPLSLNTASARGILSGTRSSQESEFSRLCYTSRDNNKKLCF